jgi:hypothetical protein
MNKQRALILAVFVASGIAFACASILVIHGWIARAEVAGPFVLEFGRGSGMRGLDTVKILEDGTAILHERTTTGVKVARLQLPPEELQKVRRLIEKHRLLALDRSYSNGWADGTQWIVRIKHDGGEKAAYFDNLFPAAITEFADELDVLLNANGLPTAIWRPAELGYSDDLWKSIR